MEPVIFNGKPLFSGEKPARAEDPCDCCGGGSRHGCCPSCCTFDAANLVLTIELSNIVSDFDPCVDGLGACQPLLDENFEIIGYQFSRSIYEPNECQDYYNEIYEFNLEFGQCDQTITVGNPPFNIACPSYLYDNHLFYTDDTDYENICARYDQPLDPCNNTSNSQGEIDPLNSCTHPVSDAFLVGISGPYCSMVGFLPNIAPDFLQCTNATDGRIEVFDPETGWTCAPPDCSLACLCDNDPNITVTQKFNPYTGVMCSAFRRYYLGTEPGWSDVKPACDNSAVDVPIQYIAVQEVIIQLDYLLSYTEFMSIPEPDRYSCNIPGYLPTCYWCSQDGELYTYYYTGRSITVYKYIPYVLGAYWAENNPDAPGQPNYASRSKNMPPCQLDFTITGDPSLPNDGAEPVYIPGLDTSLNNLLVRGAPFTGWGYCQDSPITMRVTLE